MMNPRILIIDDEEDIRDLYRSFLEDQDYVIDEAENGQEAFQKASKEQYDLYITDIMMPEMNGVEFIKVLKMIDPDAVVIIVTGYDDMHYTRQALEYGAFRYLTKPINMREFKSIIELGLVERKKLFHSTSAEKLKRLKDKLINNPELHQKVYTKMQNFLMQMEAFGASYIELGGQGAENIVWAKIKNKFRAVSENKSFTQDEINIMILSTLSQNELDTLIEQKHLKFNIEFESKEGLVRHRFTTFFERGELGVGIKPTRRFVQPLEKLRIPQQVLEQLTFKHDASGLILITGTSGSGKSSFIDSIIRYNNNNLNGSIILLQESPEFYHNSKKCLVRHIEIGSDVNNLYQGLDNTLIMNPNIVVVDEIPNFEILEQVLKLIDSGSLVFATMRTKSAVESLYKLFSTIPSNLQNQISRRLAMSLKVIVSLSLIHAKDDSLILAKDILINNNSVTNMLVNDNYDELYNIMSQNKAAGMQTIEQEVMTLVKQGVVSPESALESVNNVSQFKEMVKYR